MKKGGEGLTVYSAVYTNKSVDSDEQTFDILPRVKLLSSDYHEIGNLIYGSIWKIYGKST